MAAKKVSRAGIYAWMLYDWAAQPFHTLILTFVFAPYFAAHFTASPEEGQQLWGLAIGTGGLLIALLAPLLGALADLSGPRKPWIAGFSVLFVAGTSLLYLAVPGSSLPTAFVLAAFVMALVGEEFATVFTNAMMPGLVGRAGLGKLSGSGWALGYVGGIVSLAIVLAFMSASPETGKTLIGIAPVFGLDAATHQGTRASGPLTAFWYLLFVIPLFVFTPDVPVQKGRKADLSLALEKLCKTLRGLPHRASYFAFLLSSMIYRDALNALYAFAGIYAAGVLGLSIIAVGVFGILAAIAGAIGAFLGGRLDKRFGARAIVFWNCWILIAACLIVLSTTRDAVFFVFPATGSSLPQTVFYAAGCLIGAAGGALQAASRALLVDQVADGEVTEAFGLYALAGRATAFIAPFAIAAMTFLTGSQRLGITPIIILFAVGAFGLHWVRQQNPATR